jgi:serine/threonine protein phosphatase PrpC
MTRSLGDLVAKSVGVTYEPEIKTINNLTKNDKFIVLASDGLWDRISNEEVTKIISSPFYEKGDAEGAVTFLIKEAAERWQREQGMIDDITIILVFINPGLSTGPQAAAYFPENSSQGVVNL